MHRRVFRLLRVPQALWPLLLWRLQRLHWLAHQHLAAAATGSPLGLWLMPQALRRCHPLPETHHRQVAAPEVAASAVHAERPRAGWVRSRRLLRY